MKTFKMVWEERVCDGWGDTLYFEKKSQIIEAKDEDEACDKWDAEHDWNENINGLDDCFEIIEHELFEKRYSIDMPDGIRYVIPIEYIARLHAETVSIHSDISDNLRNVTIPLFESDENEIFKFVKSLKWKDLSRHATAYKKKIDQSEMQKQLEEVQGSIV